MEDDEPKYYCCFLIPSWPIREHQEEEKNIRQSSFSDKNSDTRGRKRRSTLVTSDSHN